ncbi:MAG: GAF domain-containing protein [Chlorobium sp.]|nr:MAG: diguanylate cyclase [Chlorobium sp.]
MNKTTTSRVPKNAFALAFVMILGSSVYMGLRLQAFNERTRQVERSLQVEHKLDETLSLVTDAETGPRGYVIMGQEVFLEPYFTAISSTDGIIPHLQELRRLTFDSPRQQQLLDKLDPLVSNKLDFMNKVVEKRRGSGFEAAKELIATDIGRQEMVEVRHELLEMHNIESVLLKQRSNDAAINLQDTVFALITGVGSGISLLVFSFIVVNREVGKRKRAEEELLQLNSELNSRIEKRIEELRKSEETFRLMVESVKDYAIYMLDRNGEVLSWNKGAEFLKGYKAEEIIGENFSRFFTEEDIAAGKPSLLLRTAVEQGKVEDEGLRVRKDGKRFFADVVITSTYDANHQLTGFAKVTRDITVRKENESRNANLNRIYATLSQINETLVRVKDKEQLFPAICRVAVESGKFGLAWIGMLDLESGVITPTVVYSKIENILPFNTFSINDAPFSNGILSKAVATGDVISCNNIQTDPAMQHWRNMAVAGGFHSAISVPVRQCGVIVALLNVYATEVNLFNQEEINLLKEIGEDVSFALDTLHLAELHKQTEASLIQSEKRFKEMFEEHSAIMLTFNPDTGFIMEANKAAIEFYGWTIDEIRKLRIHDINTLTPEEVERAIEQTKTGEKNHFLFRHSRANGSIRDVEVYSRTIVTDGRSFVYTIVHDVTERKDYEIATELHLALLEMAENHSITELLQLSLDKAEQLTESSIGFFHFVAEDQITLSLHAWSTNTEKNMCKAEGEGQHYALDSAGVWADAARERKAVIHNDYVAVKDRKGMPEGHAEVKREVVVPVLRGDKVVAILGVGNKLAHYDERDIKWVSIVADIAWDIVAKKMGEEERKILQAQKYAIENLAMHDSLTGLPNRRLLSEQIKLTIALCQRSRTMAALMIFDLDKFKPVNDTLGHGIGDLLLQQVANRTLGILQRSSDTLARFGGDEFVVLLPQIAAIANAVAVAEKILNALQEPFEIEGHAINISCSIGIAVFPDHGENELTLIKNADDAMYFSKSHGRSCVTVFHP